MIGSAFDLRHEAFEFHRRSARRFAEALGVPVWLFAPEHADPPAFPRMRLFRWLP